MTGQVQPLTRHDITKIVQRCWKDKAFRKEFIDDPTAVFVKYLQISATSLPKISAHQEEPGSCHIVLPAKPANTTELSEEELEGIVGGINDWELWAAIKIGISKMRGALQST
jgi:hypothetical protein